MKESKRFSGRQIKGSHCNGKESGGREGKGERKFAKEGEARRAW